MVDTRIFLTPARIAAAFVPNWSFPAHIQAFQKHTMRLMADPNYNRLVVDVACRHGKSFWFSFIVPAWYLLTHPGHNVIICAHTQDLASEFVSQIRALLLRIAPLAGRRVDPDQKNLSHVRVLGGAPSELYAIGRGGAIAGRGASLICVDDALKDQTEAASPTIRNGINTWFHSELLTRAMPGAKIIICMSRRHPDDLSGFCLQQNGTLTPADHWHHVRFPAISSEGQALWPEQYSLDKLQRIRAEYEQTGHGYIFDCLFLQDPTADPAAQEFPRSYFEDIWYTETPQNIQYRYGAIDPAQGKSDTGDYSSAVCMLVDAQDINYVDDLLLVRQPIPEFEEACAAFFVRNPCDAVLCESNIQSGLGVHIDDIAQRRYNTQLYMNEIHHVEPKEVRLRKYLSKPLSSGMLKFRDTPLMRVGVRQIMDLFGGTFVDFADAVAMAFEMRKAHLGEAL